MSRARVTMEDALLILEARNPGQPIEVQPCGPKLLRVRPVHETGPASAWFIVPVAEVKTHPLGRV